MGRMQREKGKTGEREFADLMSKEMGFDIKRKLGQERDGGDDVEIGKFIFDVKRCQTLRPQRWAEEIESQARPDQVPITAYRRNGEPWRIIMRLEDFIPLLRGEVIGT